ncbi:MAG: CIA30 family protein [Candidatus Polarisedimenticolia bacterium]|nr:CIA30 family protein [bacterium]
MHQLTVKGRPDEGYLLLVDFLDADAAAGWFPIGDAVMGGASKCELVPGPAGATLFRGFVSLANHGGYASVRSPAFAFDLAGFEGVALRVRGDGKRYKLNLKVAAEFDALQYQAAFETPNNAWITVKLPFAAFVPVYHGKLVPDAPPLDRSAIRSFGFVIADRQWGFFQLELASISVYR